MKNKLKGSSGFLIVLIIAFFAPTGSAFAEATVLKANHKEFRVQELPNPPPNMRCYKLHAPQQDLGCGKRISIWVVEIRDPNDPSKDIVRMQDGGNHKCKDVALTQPLSASTFDLSFSFTDKDGEKKQEDLTGIAGAQDTVVWLRFTDPNPKYCNQRCYWRMGYKVCYP